MHLVEHHHFLREREVVQGDMFDLGAGEQNVVDSADNMRGQEESFASGEPLARAVNVAAAIKHQPR